MDKEILQVVKSALARVYEKHFYLIENRVSERSIAFWFGVYFYELLKGTKFENLDIDMEYNRNFQGTKRTRNFRRGTFPDFILHERGSNENNILIIEFKPWWNKRTDNDIVKLCDFTRPDGDYRYNIGLSITFGKVSPTCRVVTKGKVLAENKNE